VVGSGVEDTAGVLGGRLTLGARAWGSTTSGQDCIGQGTFVADLVAAARRPGVGFAGIAPAAKVLAVGVTDQTGITIGDVLATGIRTAVNDGARVVDVAVPVQSGTSALAAAVAYATAEGVLIVAPDAFDGGGQASNQSPVYPAAYPGVLSVSDLAPGGTVPQGGTPVQRVDLAAPGDQVMSLGPGGAGYFTASGPSYAAALVAGTAALVLGSQPKLTPAQLRSRLESTAYHPGTALPDPQVGYGTVDPVAAVTDVLPGEDGATAASGARRTRADVMTRPVVVDNSRAEEPALTVGAGALVVVLAAGALGLVLPRARRRGWRTGPVPPGTAASTREV
jgi:subtilisin family serine protease